MSGCEDEKGADTVSREEVYRDALRDIASGRVTGENAAALARMVLGGAR